MKSLDKNHLSKKIALVTGGSRGIGAGIVRALAADGYDISLTYATQRDAAEEVAVQVREIGRRCLILKANLEEADAAARVVSETVRHLGGLDLLVNNAGVTVFGSIASMELSKMETLINLNFRGYLLAAQAAAAHMIQHGVQGNIICITSSRGERAYPGDAVYGGIKAALNRAVESMALDLAPYGIRVNCIAPGATRVREGERAKGFYNGLAPRIPRGRIGLPEDIGNAVVWLASEKADYITGITLRIDGGLILPGMPEAGSGAHGQGWGFTHEEIKKGD